MKSQISSVKLRWFVAKTEAKKSIEILHRRFVSGGCDNLVKLWRYDDSQSRWVEEAKLEAHSDWVRDVAWAPAVGVHKSVIASCSQVRRIWF